MPAHTRESCSSDADNLQSCFRCVPPRDRHDAFSGHPLLPLTRTAGSAGEPPHSGTRRTWCLQYHRHEGLPMASAIALKRPACPKRPGRRSAPSADTHAECLSPIKVMTLHVAMHRGAAADQKTRRLPLPIAPSTFEHIEGSRVRALAISPELRWLVDKVLQRQRRLYVRSPFLLVSARQRRLIANRSCKKPRPH